MFLNKAIVCGNLTRDPEVRYLPTTGAAVTSLSIATNRVWTDDAGERHEDADFHNVVIFGRQAETSAEYLKKGQMVLVEGRATDPQLGRRGRHKTVPHGDCRTARAVWSA